MSYRMRTNSAIRLWPREETGTACPRFFTVALMLLATLAFLSGCGAGSTPAEGEGEDTGSEPEPVTIVQLAPPAMLEALQAGEIDGFVAWEPFPAKAVEAGGADYLVDSGETWPGHPCCVLAALPAEVPEQVQTALLWAHVRATQFLNDPANAEKVRQYAVEFTGYSEQVVEESLSHLTFTETIALDGLQEYYASLVEQDLLTRDPQEEGGRDAFWSTFADDAPLQTVRERLGDDPDWVPEPVSPETPVRLGYISKDLHELAVFIAEKEGYFAAVGLASESGLELKPFPNGVAIMQAFQTGEIDASYLGAAPAILKGVNDQIPITLLAGANTEGSALVVANGAGVQSVPALAGRTVAVPQVGTVQYVLLRRLLEQNGLTWELE